MALPASGPISSSMVAQEFSSSQAPSGPNISLGGLGTKLSTPITYGNQVLMGSNFYGQSLVTLTSFSYNSEGQETGAAACALESTEDTAYHNGSGTYPDVDDVVYSNSSGTLELAQNTYKYDNGGSGGFMAVAEDGEVANLGTCGR